ncbi:hypothetical protein HGRIS_009075 [Hohenbuehelia grisea]|uniref:DUF6535 domain-containing protein n=1 Tax=Hohenbuehelia grisea TaxID=104357 RepID=A0ABR3J0G5_9AGAR
MLKSTPKFQHASPQQLGFVDPRDYEKKYPEDAKYEELSEDARVWRVYLDVAGEYDAELVNKASDSLDLLLVFARFSVARSLFL